MDSVEGEVGAGEGEDAFCDILRVTEDGSSKDNDCSPSPPAIP